MLELLNQRVSPEGCREDRFESIASIPQCQRYVRLTGELGSDRAPAAPLPTDWKSIQT
jgi:hypothetical protein